MALANEHKLKILKVLDQVSEDAENDIKEIEGKPFTGATIAIFHGQQNAMIQALADIIKLLVEEA